VKVAWRVSLLGETSLVAAEKRSRAVYRTVRSCRDAGYSADWREARATRAPEYDHWAEVDSSGACWDERYLPNAAATKGGGQ
jgi:hypothetical protein